MKLTLCSSVHIRTMCVLYFCELFSDLLAAFLIGIFLALFEQFPALAAHDHALSAWYIFHARHKLSTEHRVTVPRDTAWKTMADSQNMWQKKQALPSTKITNVTFKAINTPHNNTASLQFPKVNDKTIKKDLQQLIMTTTITHSQWHLVYLRWWFAWSPVKLVLQLSFCFSQSGLHNIALSQVQLRVLLNELPHCLLYKCQGSRVRIRHKLSWSVTSVHYWCSMSFSASLKQTKKKESLQIFIHRINKTVHVAGKISSVFKVFRTESTCPSELIQIVRRYSSCSHLILLMLL